MSESAIKKRMRLCLGRIYKTVAFNYPVGTFFAGRVLKTIKGVIHLLGGRVVKVGFPGMPDVIGWHSVIITEDMVGRIIAVFVGVEIKTDTNDVSDAQAHILARLEKDGALCGVARCEADLERIMRKLEGKNLSDFAMRISPELHEELAKKADEEGVSLNQYVLYALSRALPRDYKPTKKDRLSVEGFEPLYEITDEPTEQENNVSN